MAPIILTRRSFLNLAAYATLGMAAGAASRSRAAQGPSNPVDPAEDVTRQLAHYLVSAREEDIPAGVRKEATRTLLNFVGVAVGGCRHESVAIALAAIMPFSGAAQAQILGRR